MIYRSPIIEEHPTRESAVAPYVTGRDYRTFCALNTITWPHPAWAFARANNFHTDYVDNCWLRVAIDAPSLRTFLAFGVDTERNLPELIDRVRDGLWYVINEEEF